MTGAHEWDTTFRVLGCFEAWHGDQRVRLRRLLHRRLLAVLLAARCQMVSTDRIVHCLWPMEIPDRPRSVLQTFVSQLRRELEPHRAPRAPARLLVTAPPGYVLRATKDAVDAWRFENLVRRSGRALDRNQPSEALRDVDAALLLWTGPVFAEFAGEPWVLPEHQRYVELRMVAIERRATALLELGRHDDAIPELRAHATAHPLREEAWRLLALALYRGGRQGEALSVLRHVNSLLRRELGVDPGPPLRWLEADILRHAAHLQH